MSNQKNHYPGNKKYCSMGHPLFGSNMTLKDRTRIRKNRVYIWKERCCNECYRKWRADYVFRQQQKENTYFAQKEITVERHINAKEYKELVDTSTNKADKL